MRRPRPKTHGKALSQHVATVWEVSKVCCGGMESKGANVYGYGPILSTPTPSQVIVKLAALWLGGWASLRDGQKDKNNLNSNIITFRCLHVAASTQKV